MRGVYTYSELPDVPTIGRIDLAYTTSSRAERSAAIEARVDEGTLYLTNAARVASRSSSSPTGSAASTSLSFRWATPRRGE